MGKSRSKSSKSSKLNRIKFNLASFSEINQKRCEEHFYDVCSWSLSDWGCALAGEAGEACNFIKKIRRLQGKKDEKSSKERKALKKELAKELADVFCYLDLISTQLKIDLGKEIIDKFNEVSGRKGAPPIEYSDVE